MSHLSFWPPRSHSFSPPHDRSIWIDYICPLWLTPTSWHPGIERSGIREHSPSPLACKKSGAKTEATSPSGWVTFVRPFHLHPQVLQYADMMTQSVTHTFCGVYLHSSHLHMHTPGALSFSGPSAPTWALNSGVRSPRGAPALTSHVDQGPSPRWHALVQQ